MHILLSNPQLSIRLKSNGPEGRQGDMLSELWKFLSNVVLAPTAKPGQSR